MELSFFDKMKMKLYYSGMKGFGPAILARLPVGTPEWFALIRETMKSNDLDLRSMMVPQLLHEDCMKKGPRQRKYLSLLYDLMESGTIDEKREIVTFIKENVTLFDPNDEMLLGRITVAQRDVDPRIANMAEEALKLLKGGEE